MRTEVKKWGNSAVVRIPKPLMKQCNLEVDSPINLIVEGNKIIVEPIEVEYTLEELLRQSPARSLTLDDEDKAWLNADPVGKEAL